MNRSLVFVLLGLLPLAIAVPSIKHVIVLMMENRSFDHMLGLMTENDPTIEGCTPTMGRMCQNPLDPLDPNSQWYSVTPYAVENCTGGPSQSYSATLNQVFGYNPSAGVVNMDGFIRAYSQKQHIMDSWPPDRVPAITTLAENFAVFNRYYCSVPGQTYPNRLFLFACTSDGDTNDHDVKASLGYRLRSIFQNIDESKYNRKWSVYWTDLISANLIEYVRQYPNRQLPMSQFFADAASGNLADFVFLEPRYNNDPVLGLPSQDQEAPHNVGQGDRFIKSVYEAIRASPAWNETLFVLTYDEHGGFFDHIPTPLDAPSPDGINSKDSTPPGFNFTRLGVRVPTILISPLIPKGLRVGEPKSGRYEHSSLSSTLINLLIPDMGYLTKRDAWAAPYDWVVSLQTPRTDCPTELPLAPITDDED